MGKQARIAEIKGWLSAYRNGWVAYDRQHVQQLRAELTNLTQASA